MIIHESRKALNLLTLLLLFSTFCFGQHLEPAPTFRLMNPGYGAAALGLGGAFVAVANDPSAIYWNPAGLAQLPGFQIFGDYRIMGDSDEDFAEEVFPNRFESIQRFEISGDQLQSIVASYAFETKTVKIVPAFAWHRLAVTGPQRALKEQAGVVEFFERDTFIESQGIFQEEFKDDEEEFSFAVSAQASPKILVGGSWSFLRDGPEQNLNGTFHDALVQITPGIQTRTDLNLQQTYLENRSGNYLKLGLLLNPHGSISFGTMVRFPYTVTSDITLTKNGPFIQEKTFLDQNGQVIGVEITNGSLNVEAEATSEIEIPMELTAGLSIRPSNTLLVAGSVTYSDWTDVTREVKNSTNPVILPNRILPYPALRPTAIQGDILQWRAGTEYLFGHFGRGLVVRTGIFRDGQPYRDGDGERVYFHGYSVGAGFGIGSFRLDGAFVSQKAEFPLTPNSSDDAHLKDRRWVISLGYISL